MPGGYITWRQNIIPAIIFLALRYTDRWDSYCQQHPRAEECQKALDYIKQQYLIAEQEAILIIEDMELVFPPPIPELEIAPLEEILPPTQLEGEALKEALKRMVKRKLIDARQINEETASKIKSDIKKRRLTIDNIQDYFAENARQAPLSTCAEIEKGICKGECEEDERYAQREYCSPLAVCCVKT